MIWKPTKYYSRAVRVSGVPGISDTPNNWQGRRSSRAPSDGNGTALIAAAFNALSRSRADAPRFDLNKALGEIVKVIVDAVARLWIGSSA